jgi:transcriptional regulator with XRE-family HTH domain
MSESIYKYVLEQLEQVKGTWPEVAAATGISHRTLEKIARQETKKPGIHHIESLAGYFRSRASKQSDRHPSTVS